MWEPACTYAVLAMNSRPAADSYSGVSFYEILNLQPPDLTHRIPFFAPSVALNEPRIKRKRWQPKGILCNVLYPTTNSRGSYEVYIPSAHVIQSRYDVTPISKNDYPLSRQPSYRQLPRSRLLLPDHPTPPLIEDPL